MDDYCFDRAVACKRNLNCVFSFDEKKYYFDKFSHTFFCLGTEGGFFFFFHKWCCDRIFKSDYFQIFVISDQVI